MKRLLIILALAGAAFTQVPRQQNPLVGLPKPSATVKEQGDMNVTITLPAAFATALEKDRVDTLIPVPKKDGPGYEFVPLNKDIASHLQYLLLQDGGALVSAIKKYPPADIQASIDSANAAAVSLQQTINAAREAAKGK